MSSSYLETSCHISAEFCMIGCDGTVDTWTFFTAFLWIRHVSSIHIYFREHSLTIADTERYTILRNLHDAFRDYVQEVQKEPHLNDSHFRNGILRFLLRQIYLMQDIINPELVNVPQDVVAIYYMATWRLILNTVHRALEGLNSLPNDPQIDPTVRARGILAEIDKLDIMWSEKCEVSYPDPVKHFEQWAAQFDPRDEFVSDDVVTDLMRLLPLTENETDSRRARRIEYSRSPLQSSAPAESQENKSSPDEGLTQAVGDNKSSAMQLDEPHQTEQHMQRLSFTDIAEGTHDTATGRTSAEEVHGHTAEGGSKDGSSPAGVVQSSVDGRHFPHQPVSLPFHSYHPFLLKFMIPERQENLAMLSMLVHLILQTISRRVLETV